MSTLIRPALSDRGEFEALLRQFLYSSPGFRTDKTRREYRTMVRSFRRWWVRDGERTLDELVLVRWMDHLVRRASIRTAETMTIPLKSFFEFLIRLGRLDRNPFSVLRAGHRQRGIRGILKALRKAAFELVAPAPADHPFSGPLGASIVGYLDSLSALGKKCESHRVTLASFERHLRALGIERWNDVDEALIAMWISDRPARSEYQQRVRLVMVDGLFCYLTGRYEIASSPVPPIPPHRRRYRPPYVLSRDEIRALLESAGRLPDHRLLPSRGATYRMAFLTLYSLGLRSCEALELRLSDLDFVQHSLTIRTSKFYKGRVLPIGPRYEAALVRFIEGQPLLRNATPESFLFPSDSGRTPHLTRDAVYRVFHRLAETLRLTPPPDVRSPNLHSFRHSFAVHRVEEWLRREANVEAKLPLLSAFLGHVDAAATQVYLTMTPERLRLLGERFEAYAGRGVGR